MIKVELKFKEKVLKKIDIEKPEITIGRSPKTDIQIDNLGVSKLHARFIKQKDQYAVEDLNSTNGTFLNDRKITRVILKHNDIVTVGKHTLVIHYNNEIRKPTEDFEDRTIKIKT